MFEAALRACLQKRVIFSPNPALLESCAREKEMKEVTKRAASEAFAQMLAVTAMLVIAGVIFYSR
jgi:hypothetical protein